MKHFRLYDTISVNFRYISEICAHIWHYVQPYNLCQNNAYELIGTNIYEALAKFRIINKDNTDSISSQHERIHFYTLLH